MSLTEFVESPGYKKFMGKVYGLGASVVILGALFKILHLPGAAIMLILGLGTEAIIFALSAFEPPHEMPDWSLVYPELVGLDPSDSHHGKVSGGGSDLAALVQSGHLEPEVIEKLTDGIKKLSTTSSQLSDLSNASLATETYLQNIKQAGSAVSELASVQTKTASALEESVGKLSKSYEASAKTIADSGNNLKDYFAQLQNNNQDYTKKLDDVTKNLSAINSAYELQLQGLNSQAEASQALTSGMTEIKANFEKSVADAQVYSQQVAQLSKTVSDLNTIYGNMLSAMNMGNK